MQKLRPGVRFASDELAGLESGRWRQESMRSLVASVEGLDARPAALLAAARLLLLNNHLIFIFCSYL